MNKMAIGYHSAENGKYVISGSNTVIDQAYVTAIALDPQINETSQYGSGKLLGKFKKDNGYTGNIGVTAQDSGLEEATGRTVKLSVGVGTVGGAATKRLDGYYYEFKEETENGTKQVKVWLLDVEIGASSINHATDKESLEFGEYSYPITVYGKPLMSADGKTEYLDNNGVGRQCFMITCRPGEAGYADFGKSVPIPKVSSETTTTTTTTTE